MPNQDPDIRDEILSQLKWLRVATIAIGIVITILVGYMAWRLSAINDSLCTFRSDLQTRVDGTKEYLDHPDKYPGIKIPRSVIESQLKAQQQTIDSLSSLHC
jgi:hypothetical protein